MLPVQSHVESMTPAQPKKYRLLVRNRHDQNAIVLTYEMHQGSGAHGQTVIVQAKHGSTYQLQDLSDINQYGPRQLKTKRVGNNLHIMFDNGNVADIIIEDYYEETEPGINNLVGQAENGIVYDYIPENAQGSVVSSLVDGSQAVDVTLGGTHEVLDAAAPAAFWDVAVLPSALGLSGLGAALAALGGRKSKSSTNTDPQVANKSVQEITDAGAQSESNNHASVIVTDATQAVGPVVTPAAVPTTESGTETIQETADEPVAAAVSELVVDTSTDTSNQQGEILDNVGGQEQVEELVQPTIEPTIDVPVEVPVEAPVETSEELPTEPLVEPQIEPPIELPIVPLKDISTTLIITASSFVTTNFSEAPSKSVVYEGPLNSNSKTELITSSFIFNDMGKDVSSGDNMWWSKHESGSWAGIGFGDNKQRDPTTEIYRITSTKGPVSSVQIEYSDLQVENKTVNYYDSNDKLIFTQTLVINGNGTSMVDTGTFADGAQASYWEITAGTRDFWFLNKINCSIKTLQQYEVLNGSNVQTKLLEITGTLTRELDSGEKVVIFQNDVPVNEVTSVTGTQWSFTPTITSGSTNTFEAKVMTADGTVIPNSTSPSQTFTHSEDVPLLRLGDVLQTSLAREGILDIDPIGQICEANLSQDSYSLGTSSIVGDYATQVFLEQLSMTS